MIKEAAILKNGVILVGRRHNDIIRMMSAAGMSLPVTKGAVQGFIDDKGDFLTRQQAEVHARACGQLTKPCIGSVLTSEDLW